MSNRKYRGSQRIKFEEHFGTLMKIYVVDDLSNEELQQHYEKAFNKENYEYMEALWAEASSRDLVLKLPEA